MLVIQDIYLLLSRLSPSHTRLRACRSTTAVSHFLFLCDVRQALFSHPLGVGTTAFCRTSPYLGGEFLSDVWIEITLRGSSHLLFAMLHAIYSSARTRITAFFKGLNQKNTTGQTVRERLANISHFIYTTHFVCDKLNFDHPCDSL